MLFSVDDGAEDTEDEELTIKIVIIMIMIIINFFFFQINMLSSLNEHNSPRKFIAGSHLNIY